jgi:hypothetical protein
MSRERAIETALEHLSNELRYQSWVPAIIDAEDADDAWRIYYDDRVHIETGKVDDARPGLLPLLVYKGSGEVTTDLSGRLASAWDFQVQGIADHDPDQEEYLNAMRLRDELDPWRHRCDRALVDLIADSDARFRTLTREDSRLRARFAPQAGPGWWWDRMPLDPKTTEEILRDPPVPYRVVWLLDLLEKRRRGRRS